MSMTHDSKLLCFLLPIPWSGRTPHVNDGRCEASRELVNHPVESLLTDQLPVEVFRPM